jgi:hypothetical protein
MSVRAVACSAGTPRDRCRSPSRLVCGAGGASSSAIAADHFRRGLTDVMTTRIPFAVLRYRARISMYLLECGKP